MTCTHGHGSWKKTDLIGAFQYRKVGGFVRVQLTDFILYWHHNSKVRITMNLYMYNEHTKAYPPQFLNITTTGDLKL